MDKENELIETIETSESIVKVYANGMLESIIKEGAYIDVPYLEKGKEQIQALLGEKKAYVLTESLGFYSISRAARKLSASKEYSNHITAVAVVITHVFTKYVAELYLKLDKPASTTKVFVNRHLAIKWLKEKMKEDGV